MKIALVSLNDSADVHQWSGLNYFIARALEHAGADVARIGPLETTWTTAMRLRQRWHALTGRTYHAVIEPKSLDAMGRSARAAIPRDADAVVSVTSLVAAAVGRLDRPHVSWDDATNAAMEHYYPDFQRMAAISRRHSVLLGQRAADAVDLAVYASDWARDSARDAYRMSPHRLAVVPFGANLEPLPSDAEVDEAIGRRRATECRLLWIGVDWHRKGGPLTLDIARAMAERGVPVSLTIVGTSPEDVTDLPPWVRLEGFVSKRELAGRQRLADLFAEAHFFVMPSAAEAYGLVYAEASTFGTPCVAMRTGGVPTIVADRVTGVLLEPGASPSAYAERMLELLTNREAYLRMARAARARAVTTLNWPVAGGEMLRLIQRLVDGRVSGGRPAAG